MKKIILLGIMILMGHSIIFGQRYGSDKTKMERQATISPTIEQIGLTLFFETIFDPLRLKDLRKVSDPNSKLSGIEKIDPTFKVALAYTSPWFLYNYIQVVLGFEFFGRYLYKGNDLLGSGYKETFNYQVIFGVNITPYLYIEFDSRGRMETMLSYAYRTSASGYITADIDTKLWLLGNGYTAEGKFARHFWEYTSINVAYFYTVHTPPTISSITAYSRFRLRFQGSIYDPYISIDGSEEYGLSHPNLKQLVYIGLKTGIDLWFTPYVAMKPFIELFANGFETNKERFPLGLNLGIKVELLL